MEIKQNYKSGGEERKANEEKHNKNRTERIQEIKPDTGQAEPDQEIT